MSDSEYDPASIGVLAELGPLPRRPAGHIHEPAHVVAQVILTGGGHLFVEAPGAPPTRIVAIPEKRAGAVGQRVAELVAEALAERDRSREGTA